MTQCEKILDYMKRNGSISPIDALREFGCMRLAARVNDLINKGFSIKSEMVSYKNTYGDNIRYAVYRLA